MDLQPDSVDLTLAITSVLLALLAFGIAIDLYRSLRGPDRHRGFFWLVGLCLLGVSGLTGIATYGFDPVGENVINILVNIFHLCRVLAAAMFLCGVGYDLHGPRVVQRALPFVIAVGFGVYLILMRLKFPSFLIATIETMAMLAVFTFYSWLASRFHFPGARWLSLGAVLFILSALLQINLNFRIDFFFSFGSYAISNLIRMLSLFTFGLGLRSALPSYPNAKFENVSAVTRNSL